MRWFRNLNAAPKLMTGFAMCVAITAAVGLLGLFRVAALNNRINILYDQEVGGIQAIKEAELAKALIAACSRSATLEAGDKAAVNGSAEKFERYYLDLTQSLNAAYGKAVRPAMRDQVHVAIGLLPAYKSRAAQVFAYAKAGDVPRAKQALQAASFIDARFDEAVQRALLVEQENIHAAKQESSEEFANTRASMVSLVCSAIVLGLGLSFLIARSFSTPLKAIEDLLGRMAKGDLTKTLIVNEGSEIGRLAVALNSAVQNMRDVLREVGESSRSLTGASVQLAGAADGLATGAQEQAASLEETSASLEEITATVRQNSDNAKQACQLAISARDAAEKGGVVVNSAMRAMGEINVASGKIAAINGTINEIAFQTNLLAVNASVEAARAGEHGRGFAVVATEVRTLAQRSASAAKEIKILIGDSVHKVENGSQLVNHSGQTLHEIVTSVKNVTDIVGEIAAASQQQSAGIEQVFGAMLQMDRVMQSNSSQTEELSATARSLASQASQLEDLVTRFAVSSEPVRPRKKAAAVAAAKPSLFDAPRYVDEKAVRARPSSRSFAGLVQNIGNSAATNALDEEFEEF